jgi:hypothetical protein
VFRQRNEIASEQESVIEPALSQNENFAPPAISAPASNSIDIALGGACGIAALCRFLWHVL